MMFLDGRRNFDYSRALKYIEGVTEDSLPKEVMLMVKYF